MIVTLPKLGMKGLYKIDLVDPESDEIEESTGWFDNLITDSGLNQIASYVRTADNHPNWLDAIGISDIHVGRGTTPPTVGDLILEDYVRSAHSTFSSSKGWDYPAGYFYTSYTREFNTGTVTGLVTEVGAGDRNNLFSRAMIADGGVTVLSTQKLRITYEVRINFPSLDEQTTNFTLLHDEVPIDTTVKIIPARLAENLTSGVSTTETRTTVTHSTYTHWGFNTGQYDHTDRCAARSGLNSHTAGLGSGSKATASSYNSPGYVKDSHEVVMGYTWATSSANWAEGIKGFDWNSPFMGTWQFEVDPPIPKTSNKELYIRFITRWGRA